MTVARCANAFFSVRIGRYMTGMVVVAMDCPSAARVASDYSTFPDASRASRPHRAQPPADANADAAADEEERAGADDDTREDGAPPRLDHGARRHRPGGHI